MSELSILNSIIIGTNTRQQKTVQLIQSLS